MHPDLTLRKIFTAPRIQVNIWKKKGVVGMHQMSLRPKLKKSMFPVQKLKTQCAMCCIYYFIDRITAMCIFFFCANRFWYLFFKQHQKQKQNSKQTSPLIKVPSLLMFYITCTRVTCILCLLHFWYLFCKEHQKQKQNSKQTSPVKFPPFWCSPSHAPGSHAYSCFILIL